MKRVPPDPDTVDRIASGLALQDAPMTADRLRDCANEWRLDQAVVDAVLNSDPLRRSLLGFSCRFCGGFARTAPSVVHESWCARLLAEFARPDRESV